MTEDQSEPVALFVPDGDHLVPTYAAVGPWDPNALHGAATASLVASFLEQDDSTLARFQIDLLTPALRVPLQVRLEERTGRGRVTRQTATLLAGSDVVATARALSVRRTDLDLPASSLTSGPSPGETPGADDPRIGQADAIKWPWFGALGMVSVRPSQPVPGTSESNDLWTNLVLPVVAGKAVTGVQRAVAAADYGSIAMSNRLSFGTWKYPNADLDVQLSHAPTGPWIRVNSRAMLQQAGVAVTSIGLYDALGQVGQASQALIVGRRRPT